LKPPKKVLRFFCLFFDFFSTLMETADNKRFVCEFGKFILDAQQKKICLLTARRFTDFSFFYFLPQKLFVNLLFRLLEILAFIYLMRRGQKNQTGKRKLFFG